MNDLDTKSKDVLFNPINLENPDSNPVAAAPIISINDLTNSRVFG
jgi:hypothetical protein